MTAINTEQNSPQLNASSPERSDVETLDVETSKLLDEIMELSAYINTKTVETGSAPDADTADKNTEFDNKLLKLMELHGFDGASTLIDQAKQKDEEAREREAVEESKETVVTASSASRRIGRTKKRRTQAQIQPEEQHDRGAHPKKFAGSDVTVVGTDVVPYNSAEADPAAPGTEMMLFTTDYRQADSLNLSITDHERLDRNILKYQEKVLKYENIATNALGTRMKGRLFKNSKRHAESDTKIEDSTHFLDGFTLALDNSLMKKWILEGKSDEEAAEALYDFQQARIIRRAEMNRQELRKDPVSSVLEIYANLPRKQKILYGLGASALFGLAGATVATLGGAAAVVGAVGVVGAKVGKTYFQQRSKLYQAQPDSALHAPRQIEVGRTGDVAIAQMTAREQVIAARDHAQEQREKSIGQADRNKKIALGLAAVSAALIGGGMIAKAVEHADDIKGGWNNLFGPHDEVPKSPTETPDDGPSEGDFIDKPQVPPTELPPPEAPTYSWSAEASTVSSGEGLYQQFGQMGITDPNAQYALLHNPDLMNELYNQGFVYPDASIGGWGINMPAGGVMPQTALDTIARYATSSGYALAA